MSNRVFIGLVHYPVYNKNMQVIATSVTNLDIHDIARCAGTYNAEKYYIIHPHEAQHRLVNDIIGYWQEGYGAEYNPDRKEALDLVELKESIEQAKADIREKYAGQLFTVTTDARTYPNTVRYKDFKELLERDNDANYLLLFGTGWGMTREIMLEADYVLEPVYGRGQYNHLSVRSAVSTILDRILGEKWWE